MFYYWKVTWKSVKSYYFHKDGGLEIDFVSVINDVLSVVEVKARTGNSKSAKTVLNDKTRYNADNMIKLGEYNIGVKDNMITLPFYLSFRAAFMPIWKIAEY